MKKLLLLILFLSVSIANDVKQDTTIIGICQCDTLMIIKTYKDTTMLLNQDSVKVGNTRKIIYKIKPEE